MFARIFTPFAQFSLGWSDIPVTVWIMLGVVAATLFAMRQTMRYIPHDRVGVVEKLWSAKGSVTEGAIIALNGEAGYQANVLRGGMHFGYWRWQYRIHRQPLVAIRQGKIGYVYARDGEPLPPSQTLGRIIDCHNFQDAHTFLTRTNSEQPCGQRGRQRSILREGVYAINPALFVVISESDVYAMRDHNPQEFQMMASWQADLKVVGAFEPVIVGKPCTTPDPHNLEQEIEVDSIGIITVHDGPSLPPNEIIAPTVGADVNEPTFHNNFQNPEAFLAAGGRRGRQYQTLTDGTYFINRWFATIELMPKIVVPIGYVGVVVSYYGRFGKDVSGESFRHGERVGEGERGVWEKPLGPRQICLQSLCRQHHPRADDEFRSALGDRQDGVAPLRRKPAFHRPGHARRL